MATDIKLKSSSVLGKSPTLSDLSLRELAVNTADGKLFLRRGDGSGTDKIIDVTASLQASEPMGHEDNTKSIISFNNTTRVFTIQPSSTSFNVWVKGIKYTYTTAQTVTIPNTTGLHYIYFNSNGVLESRLSYFDWENDAPTAYVYWNAATSSSPFVADERHGITMDWATHEYLHRTRGAVIANGFSISNYTTTGTGANNTDAQFDLDSGVFFDEDLEVLITHSNTPTSDTWQQDLQGPSQIPVFYHSGTGWVRDNPTDYALKQGTARIQYNFFNGASWTTLDVPSNKWHTTSWIIATNNINYPIIAILGQSATNKLSDQESLTFNDLNLEGFPVVEFRPLWKIIWETDATFVNAPKARIAAVYDIRQFTSKDGSAGILPTGDHGLLSGLGDDDHLQYVHISENRTITASHTISGTLSITNTGTSALTIPNSRVGIGTTNPQVPLQIAYTPQPVAPALITSDVVVISAQNTAPGFAFAVAGNTGGARGVFKATRARGTLESPTAPGNNDAVFSLLGAIYDGVAVRATAQIQMDVDGVVEEEVAPQRISFWTGLTNSRSERMRISAGGNVGIATTNPQYALHVQGDINYTGTLRLNGTQLNTTNVPEGTNLYYTSERSTADAIVMAIALG
jgi:hypothetical protein